MDNFAFWPITRIDHRQGRLYISSVVYFRSELDGTSRRQKDLYNDTSTDHWEWDANMIHVGTSQPRHWWHDVPCLRVYHTDQEVLRMQKKQYDDVCRQEPTNLILRVTYHRYFTTPRGVQVMSPMRTPAYLHLKLTCMQKQYLAATMAHIVQEDRVRNKLTNWRNSDCITAGQAIDKEVLQGQTKFV